MILTKEKLKLLKENRLFIDDYAFLFQKKSNWKMSYIIEDPIKVSRRLVRRGFLNSEGLTLAGEAILDGSYTTEHLNMEELSTKESIVDQFDKFWSEYPTSDKWQHFQRTRTLRMDKKRALKYYKHITQKQKIDPDTLLRCLQKDIEMKKKASALEGVNKMKYMPAITSWLNNGHYEGFIEEVKEQFSNKEEIKQQAKRYGEDIG